jgi:hypothetical protein
MFWDALKLLFRKFRKGDLSQWLQANLSSTVIYRTLNGWSIDIKAECKELAAIVLVFKPWM